MRTRFKKHERGNVLVESSLILIVFMSMLIWALSYFPRSNEARAQYQAAFSSSIVGRATAAAPGSRDFVAAQDRYVA